VNRWVIELDCPQTLLLTLLLLTPMLLMLFPGPVSHWSFLGVFVEHHASLAESARAWSKGDLPRVFCECQVDLWIPRHQNLQMTHLSTTETGHRCSLAQSSLSFYLFYPLPMHAMTRAIASATERASLRWKQRAWWSLIHGVLCGWYVCLTLFNI
jgi:hypothetical protein